MTSPLQPLHVEMDELQRQRLKKLAEDAADSAPPPTDISPTAMARAAYAEGPSPDEQAEASKLATKTGRPVEAIQGNVQAAQEEHDWTVFDSYIRGSQPTQEWVAEQPQRARLIRDDVENMAWWEKMIHAHNEAGWGIVELADIGYAQLQGRVNQAQLQRALELEEITGIDYDAHGLANLFVESGRMIPMTEAAMLSGLEHGMAAAVGVGAAAGVVAGPTGVGALPAAAAGGAFAFKLGGLYGSARRIFQLEAGLAYREFLDMRDEEGREIDPRAARAAAYFAGMANAGLEMVSLGMVSLALKRIPGFQNMFQLLNRKAMRRALKIPTYRQALIQFGGSYALGFGGEVTTEGLQRVMTLASGQAAAAATQGYQLEDIDWGEEFASEAWGAAPGMALLPLLPAGMALVSDGVRAKKAKNAHARHQEMVKRLKQTKLYQRNRDEFRNWADKVAKEGGDPKVYVDAAGAITYFQSENVNPVEGLGELGVTLDETQDAVLARGDLVVPLSRLIEAAEKHEGLLDHVRETAGSATPLEAQAYIETMDEQVTRELEAHAEQLSENDQVEAEGELLYEEVHQKLLSLPQAPGAPGVQARVFQAFYETMARRSGMSPRELWNLLPIEFVYTDRAAGEGVAVIDRIVLQQPAITAAAIRVTDAAGVTRVFEGPSHGQAFEAAEDIPGFDDIPMERFEELFRTDDGRLITREEAAAEFTDITAGRLRDPATGRPLGRATAEYFDSKGQPIRGAKAGEVYGQPAVDAYGAPKSLADLEALFVTQAGMGIAEAAALGSLVRGVAAYKKMDPDQYVQQRFAGLEERGNPAKDALFAIRSISSGREVEAPAVTAAMAAGRRVEEAEIQQYAEQALDAGMTDFEILIGIDALHQYNRVVGHGHYVTLDSSLTDSVIIREGVLNTPPIEGERRNRLDILYDAIQNGDRSAATGSLRGGEERTGIPKEIRGLTPKVFLNIPITQPRLQQPRPADLNVPIFVTGNPHISNFKAPHPSWNAVIKVVRVKPVMGGNSKVTQATVDAIQYAKSIKAKVLITSFRAKQPWVLAQMTNIVPTDPAHPEFSKYWKPNPEPRSTDPLKAPNYVPYIPSGRGRRVHEAFRAAGWDTEKNIFGSGGTWWWPTTRALDPAVVKKVGRVQLEYCDMLHKGCPACQNCQKLSYPEDSDAPLVGVTDEPFCEHGCPQCFVRLGQSGVKGRRGISVGKNAKLAGFGDSEWGEIYRASIDILQGVTRRSTGNRSVIDYVSDFLNGDAGDRLDMVMSLFMDGRITGEQLELMRTEIATQAAESPERRGDESGPLFSLVDDRARASVEFDQDDRALIRALNAPTVADMAHELGHVFRRDLSAEDAAIIEGWLGVEDGVWTRKHEEEFALGFERFLVAGEAPSRGMRRVFAQFKRWMSRIFKELPEPQVPLSRPALEVMGRLTEGGAHVYKQPVKEGKEKPRGQIEISPTRTSAVIRMFETGNLSTVVHEAGHAFLEVFEQLASQPAAPQQIKDDWNTLRGWAGALPGQKLTEEQIEKITEYWEKQYLARGQAPSEELASAFSRFKAWLFNVYRLMKDLGRQVHPEVDAVFARWLATDEQIARAEAARDFRPAWMRREDSPLTEAEWAQYQAAQERQSIEVRDAAQQRELSEKRREQRRFLREQEDEIRDRVTREVDESPVFRAQRWLRAGEWQGEQPPGLPYVVAPGSEPAFPMQRISKQWVLDHFGEDQGKAYLKQLGRGAGLLYQAEGGWDGDEIAAILGFGSGEELISKLAAAPRRADLIKERVDAELGAIAQTLEDPAEAAFESFAMSDARGEVLAQELAGLRRSEASELMAQAARREIAEEGAGTAAEHKEEVSEAEEAAALAVLSLPGDEATRAEALATLVRARARREAAVTGRQAQRAGLRQTRLATRMDLPQIRRRARRQIAETEIQNLRPGKFSQAELRAARATQEAIARRDYAEAAQAKQAQLLNHALFREATKACDRADKIARHLAKFEKKGEQQKLGLAGGTALDQVLTILEGVGLKRSVTKKELRERKSFVAWKAEQEAMGHKVLVPDRLVGAEVQHFREMTLNELEGLKDTVDHIVKLAKLKRKLIAAAEGRDLDATAGEMATTAYVTNSLVRPDKGEPKTREEFEAQKKPIGKLQKQAKNKLFALREHGRGFDATLLKMEQLVDWLDGGDPQGPWHQYLFNPIAQAQHFRNDLILKTSTAFEDARQEMSPESQHWLAESHWVESLGKSYTGTEILAMALNTGNESNLSKMMRGGDKDPNGIARQWTADQLLGALQMLSEDHWTFVQNVWDLFEGFRPLMSKVQKQMTGLEPVWVKDRAFTTPYGQQLRGGYYPAVYDPNENRRIYGYGQQTAEALFEWDWTKPDTVHGHMEERVEGFAAPMLFDLSVVYRHITQVAHDLAYRPALADAWKILNHPDVQAAVTDVVGPEYAKQLTPWLHGIANQFKGDLALAKWERFWRASRHNVTIMIMGWKATTAVTQLAGIGPSVELLNDHLDKRGRHWIRVGFQEWQMDPRKTYDEVVSRSGEMRHRFARMDRDLIDGMRRMQGKTGVEYQMQKTAFYAIGMGDMFISVTTWNGAFQQAVHNGLEEKAAIEYADSMVRLSQGAGEAKDLSAFQRGGEHETEFVKMFSMFMGYFSAYYNRQRAAGRQVRRTRDFAHFMMKHWWMTLLPVIMSEVLTGEEPPERVKGGRPASRVDDLWWWGGRTLGYMGSGIPHAREAISAASRGFSYRSTPLSEPFRAALALWSDVLGKSPDEWDHEALIKHAVRVVGYARGLPLEQPVNITGAQALDMVLGDEPPSLHDILFRRKRQ